MSKKPHPPEVRERILETLRTTVPFIALAAEANGISRHTVNTWLTLGKNGDPRYEAFYDDVHQIRAEWMLTHAKDLLNVCREKADKAKQTNWLLMRLDRQIFDPPNQVYHKEPSRTSPDEHATNPTAADPNKVAEALEALSKPLTIQ